MAHSWNSLASVKVDCRWFRGDVPCSPHKQHGVHCVDAEGRSCTYYDPRTENILIIKLGAIGDVIRGPMLAHKAEEEGIAVVLIEHAIEFVLTVSDTILVLSEGQVIAEGTPEEIPRNREVLEAYLGR